MSKEIGQLITVKFTEALVGNTGSNEPAFKVTGKELKYIGGPLIEGDYEIESVDLHPTEPKALLITLNPYKRFNNVLTDLTVHYDSALGTISGLGGKVASFSKAFTPSGLLHKPNHKSDENINCDVGVNVVLTRVNYNSYQNEEHITVSGNCILTFTKTDVVNP